MYSLDDGLLDRYDYADDPVLKKHLHAWDRICIGDMLTYASGIGNFGPQMTAHQNRVAKDGARFLKTLGFSERAACNFRAAMLFHDIGKTHNSYNPSIWTLEGGPTPEERALKRKHARLGADMWESFAREKPELLDHPHFAARYAVTIYHHERVDRGGPEEKVASALPVFVQVSCIVDAYDGDRIQRGHQETRRTPREALRRLAGFDDPKQKYVGAFSGNLLTRYIQMKESELDIGVL